MACNDLTLQTRDSWGSRIIGHGRSGACCVRVEEAVESDMQSVQRFIDSIQFEAVCSFSSSSSVVVRFLPSVGADKLRLSEVAVGFVRLKFCPSQRYIFARIRFAKYWTYN